MIIAPLDENAENHVLYLFGQSRLEEGRFDRSRRNVQNIKQFPVKSLRVISLTVVNVRVEI